MAATGKTGTARQSRIDKALKAAYRPELTSGAEDKVRIRVCAGSTCNASGRAAVSSALQAELDKRGLGDKVRIFKMRRRKHFRKSQGHRQAFTEIQITSING